VESERGLLRPRRSVAASVRAAGLLMALFGHGAMSNWSQLRAPKADVRQRLLLALARLICSTARSGTSAERTAELLLDAPPPQRARNGIDEGSHSRHDPSAARETKPTPPCVLLKEGGTLPSLRAS
jgi:hypothetical protein